MLSASVRGSKLQIARSDGRVLRTCVLMKSTGPSLLNGGRTLGTIAVRTVHLSGTTGVSLGRTISTIALSVGRCKTSSRGTTSCTGIVTTKSGCNSTTMRDVATTIAGTNISTSATGIPVRRLMNDVRALTRGKVIGRITNAKLGVFFLHLRAKTSRAGPGVINLRATLGGLRGLSARRVIGHFNTRACAMTRALVSNTSGIRCCAGTIANAGITVRRTTVGSRAGRTHLTRLGGGVERANVRLVRGLGPSLGVLAK